MPPLKYSYPNEVISKVEGGRLVFVMSCIDTAGRYFVLCDKHPAFNLQVYFSVLVERRADDYKRLIEDTALEALRQCPWCVSDRKVKDAYQNTRFPEGAEL